MQSTKFGSHVLPGAELPRDLICLRMRTRRKTLGSRDLLQARTGDRLQDKIAKERRTRDRFHCRNKSVGADRCMRIFPLKSLADEVNPIGHIRLNDRTGPNGEKILHLEELQTDWHQKKEEGEMA